MIGNNYLSWFTGTWIEKHFPLKSPIVRKLSYKSITKSKNNNNGPKIDHCGTPARKLVQDKLSALRTILCFLLLRNLDKMCSSSPEMPLCHNFSYQTKSKHLGCLR